MEHLKSPADLAAMTKYAQELEAKAEALLRHEFTSISGAAWSDFEAQKHLRKSRRIRKRKSSVQAQVGVLRPLRLADLELNHFADRPINVPSTNRSSGGPIMMATPQWLGRRMSSWL
jgi:hypothetical protein